MTARCAETAGAISKIDERAGAGNLLLAEKDGRLRGSFTYQLIVGQFYEWNTDPTAVPGILTELSKRTGVKARVEFKAIGLDDPQLMRNPLLIMTGNRAFRISEEEAKNLRKYLAHGGFLYVDDCGGADWSLRRMLKQVLPEAKLEEFRRDHPVLRQHYALEGIPKVVDLYHGPAKCFAITIDGRLAILYTYDTDIPCAWEQYPDGSYVHVIEGKKRESAVQFGINVLLYALRQHLGQVGPPSPPPGVTKLPKPTPLPQSAVRNYPMRRQLPCNFITAMAADDRHVWFGGFSYLPGEDEGLARYDKSTDRWRIFMDAEGVLTEEVNCLTLKGDKVLIGADTWKWTRGMATFDPATGTWSTLSTKDGLPHNRVIAIVKDGDDLWIACRRGLAILRAGSKRAEAIDSPAARRAFGEEGLYMIGLMADEHYVWANHFSGVARLDKKTKKWEALAKITPLLPGHVKDMAQAGKSAWFLSPVEKKVHLIRFAYEEQKFEKWEAARGIDL